MLHLLLALLLLAAAPARALESEAAVTPRATVTLLSEQAAIAPGQPFRLALRQRLAPGWHTYWLNPGDAGVPPDLTLTLPEGATASPLRFPAPQRIPVGPLVSFGYEGEALFTLTVTPPPGLRAGETLRVEAEATWLVCEQICIPEEGRFTLALPVAATPRAGPQAPLFLVAEAAEPQPSPFAARIGFQGRAGALQLAGPGLAPGALRDAFFFPLAQGVLDHAAPQRLTLGDGTLTLALTRGEAALPAPLEGVVAATDAAGVRSAWLVSAEPGAVPGGGGVPLWQAMLFAVLGGLILNAMPCVFPVLAMKAMAVARLSGAARQQVRGHAAGYCLGVVASFLLLGGLLSALRLGWGAQFTAPWFVALLAWLMLAVGLNLSGVFAVSGGGGFGNALAHRGGHAGSFFTGVLAVAAATPCTAPFMATALGAALALPWGTGLLVFLGLGLGMATPYALLALRPGLARLLPRPGAWMERLQQALAFPMYGAAAWLAWVLAQQVSAPGLLVVLAGAVLLALAAWALGLRQRGAGRWASLTGGGALLLLALLLTQLAPRQAPTEAADAWSAERVAALRAEGRPVFVNLTAAWCVSCKVNEQVALRDATVLAGFAEHRVASLTGDWTNGDAAITALLRAHGRDGVPLYLLYPAGGGAPLVLPQVLTPGIVLRGVKEAVGG
jgi:thiol:disulfide interchange protein DsbD